MGGKKLAGSEKNHKNQFNISICRTSVYFCIYVYTFSYIQKNNFEQKSTKKQEKQQKTQKNIEKTRKNQENLNFRIYEKK